MVRIAIAGCHGQMGKALVQAAVRSKKVKLTAATVSPKHPLLAMDVGLIAGGEPLNLYPTDDLTAIKDEFEVLVDFTAPEATLKHLRFCQQYHKKMVIGTTGLTTAQQEALHTTSATIPIVYSPNMSIGVNLCFKLLKQIAQVLGYSADIEIIEAHHRQKIDAPSGTALKMGEIIANTIGLSLAEMAVYHRQGAIGPRREKTIGFSTIRAGNIVGDHTVVFATCGEQVELTHRATNRDTFAQGAMKAANWIEEQHSAGLYTMEQVLS